MTVRVPDDYLLRRDVCSYGYYALAPNRWIVADQVFERTLDLECGPVRLRLSQAGEHGEPGGSLAVRADRRLGRPEQGDVRAQLARMLRLDESAEEIAGFHSVDPRWSSSGRGRIMRSPTMFEDVVKTITSCNVQWASTVIMNSRFCEVLGRCGAFPSARKFARARTTTLRGRCRVGYRDRRLVEIARIFASGEIDVAWCEDPTTPDDELHGLLLELPGVGPYAAANIMQLLGRYARLPLDTESLRHGRDILGFTGTDRQVLRQVTEHFAPFGRHAFRSYWLELWANYEKDKGPAWEWERG